MSFKAMTVALGATAILTMGSVMAAGGAEKGGEHKEHEAGAQTMEQGQMKVQEQTALAPERIERVEQALKQRGYDVGTVDGNWESKSKQALSEFQKAQGLEPTGELDSNTLSALGISSDMEQRAPAAEEQPGMEPEMEQGEVMEEGGAQQGY